MVTFRVVGGGTFWRGVQGTGGVRGWVNGTWRRFPKVHLPDAPKPSLGTVGSWGRSWSPRSGRGPNVHVPLPHPTTGEEHGEPRGAGVGARGA